MKEILNEVDSLDEWLGYEDSDGNKFNLNIHGGDGTKVHITMYKCSLNKDGTVENAMDEILKQSIDHSSQLTKIFNTLVKRENKQ